LFDQYGIKWTIAGSYRRGESSSGDIDLLVESRDDLDMDVLLSLLDNIIVATLAKGEKKFMGMLRLSDEYYGHRIDIRLVDPNEYVYALMYFTGSEQFNVLMRNRAIEFGLTLNEYDLSDGKNYYPATNEKDIFKH